MQVAEEIERAIRELRLTDLQIRRLPPSEEETIFRAVEVYFVASANRRFWWGDFRQPAVALHFPDGDGCQHLVSLIPYASEKIWFLAEDDSPIWAVYETDAPTVQAIIGDCYYFEYYLAAKDFRWLVGESDHNVIYAIGEPVEAKLKELVVAIK